MNSENKRKVRKVLSDKSCKWHVVDGVLGEEINPFLLGKEVEIIYQWQEMPCMCNAIVKRDEIGKLYFCAIDMTIKIPDVIAYRKIS